MKFYNIFKWHIVQLDDMYAIRKFCFNNLRFVYKDLYSRQHKWTKRQPYFKDCLSSDYSRIVTTYNTLTGKNRQIYKKMKVKVIHDDVEYQVEVNDDEFMKRIGLSK